MSNSFHGLFRAVPPVEAPPSASRRGALASAVASPLALLSAPAAAASGAPGARGLIFSKGDKLVMIGDSITDAGRKDAGEGLFEAIGHGYVMMVDALLGAFYPQLSVRVINQGKSGNTTRDLLARWQKDVLELKPDWLSVMIGTNDVWRQFDVPRMPERAVPLEEYERNLTDLVTQARGAVKSGIILMTPFYLEPNKRDAMRAQMDRYGEAVKRVAAQQRTHFVDTQAACDRVLQTYYPATLAWDRVHPNHIGTAVLARAFLDAVGFQWR